MPEAQVNMLEWDERRLVAAASVGIGEVWQLPSGEAGVYERLAGTSSNPGQAATSGQNGSWKTSGKAPIVLTAGITILDGGRVYWDHSANAAHYKKVNDRDFFLGLAVGDSSSGFVTVDLNKEPVYDIDVFRDACLSVPVGTQAVGAFGYPKLIGGSWLLELTATSEAQKIDLLSVDGFDLTANAIVEAIFSITNDGSNATQDWSVGVASGTHASNFQTITSFVAVSTVGASTAINVQSDDNSTDVAPTDSTYTYTEGSAVANRVEVWFDFRNPADVQVYVNGVLALPSSTFTAGTSGTHFLIAHLEKTSGTDVYAVRLDRLCARFSEQ